MKKKILRRIHKIKVAMFISRLKQIINNRLRKYEDVRFYDLENAPWLFLGLKILKLRKTYDIRFTSMPTYFDADVIVSH